MNSKDMAARGFSFTTVAGMQKLIPGYIFKLWEELDSLQAEMVKSGSAPAEKKTSKK
jgi:hypothetical protein